ncbi:MAG: frataxin family protein, partial [Deltaproteobacteria bacterium]|nr:frataxin family protein [Deltaproteobacteria bacterium]
ENAFDEIDPDQAECEMSQGALTISLSGGARWILSQQPAVKQLWLAVASLGRAYHYNFDLSQGVWLDDKGEGLELLSHLQGLLATHAGLQIKFFA